MLFLAIPFLIQVQSQVILSINCGGEDYIDSKGDIWQQDQYYSEGSAFEFSESRYIRFTNDPQIYKSERQHPASFSYSLPMASASGPYVIIIKNSEIFTQKGKKITNLFIGSTQVSGSTDIFEGVQDSAALDEFIEVNLTGNRVEWNGKVIEDGFSNGILLLKFVKAAGDYARVAGIRVVKGKIDEKMLKGYWEEVKRFKTLLRNKVEMSEKSLNFPREHRVLVSINLYMVMMKYPFTIIFMTIVFYLILSKVIVY